MFVVKLNNIFFFSFSYKTCKYLFRTSWATRLCLAVSVSLFLYLSVCLYISLCFSLSLSLFLSLSIYTSLSLYLSLFTPLFLTLSLYISLQVSTDKKLLAAEGAYHFWLDKDFNDIVIHNSTGMARIFQSSNYMFGTNLICYQRPKAGYET